MGYWPRKMKRKRHNWVTELGRKLVLVGCTGHHEMLWPNKVYLRHKLYVLNAPGYEGEKAWEAKFSGVQCKGWSEDSVTVKGAKMMEII